VVRPFRRSATIAANSLSNSIMLAAASSRRRSGHRGPWDFEVNELVNVFAPLDLTQRVIRRWVKSKTRGKIVFLSSVLGVVSPPMVGAYSATKYAVQAIAEAMQDELRPFGIQVQTINPRPYLTGFNETMVEAAYRWLDDALTFTSRAMVKEVTDGLLAKPEGRLNPKDMIAKMIEHIPDQNEPFRNIFPEASQE
jgi:short-subunit dehydrogenase